MAIAIAPVEVTGANLGTQHQCAARAAGTYRIGRLLDAEGARRTRYVHVVAITAAAERGLNFNGNCRVGALEVGAGDDHQIDLARCAPGFLQSVFGGRGSHFSHQGNLFVGPAGDIRAHPVGIKNAGFVDDVALFDA